MKGLEFLGMLENQVRNNYGFKSSKYPPSINKLSNSESDLFMMIHNIEFRPAQG